MSDTPKTPLVLVDGSSYLFRAFHALPPLSNSKGQPTGAVYGVLNMLRRLIERYHPENMAVVFDARGKTFRNELYPQYKANRPPMPEELAAQIEPLHQCVRALGLPLLAVPGVEADDVIGTLATQAAARGRQIVISTGDKDLAQLVEPGITLINTMNDTTMDRDGVLAKFGVPPEQIIDYLALVGDTVDNVPGVPKVGPKTAVKWLEQYGSLDEIMAHADQFKGKIGENLRASLGQLPLSKDLVTIRRDVPLDTESEGLSRAEPDRESLRALYAELEFSSWLKQLDTPQETGEDTPTSAAPEDTDYEIVLDAKALERWIKQLQKAELFAFDTETTDLDYMRADIVGVSFAVEAGKAAYVPVAHRYPGAPDQLQRETVLERLRPLLEDAKKPKLGQNLKYDMSVLARAGIDMQGIAHDTMLESYVLDSTATRHDMDSLALKYLGHQTIHYEDVAGKGKKQLRFDQIELEQAGPYAAEDADITLRLHQTLWPRLEVAEGQAQLYRQIEIPLVPVLSRIERNGVLIDRAMLGKQSTQLAKRMLEIEQAAYDAAGGPFNLGSPSQLQQILFTPEGLNITPRAKTPKGQPSTAESVLQELAEEGHDLPRLILEHRSLSKLKSTYTDKLPEQIDPDTGRVHTSYHQAVAATGRLSSSDPNLQNIPVRSDEGRRIRQAFVAPEGKRIVAADYSQIELRIMAHLSGDEGLLKAFAAGADVHAATAAEIFGTTPDKVTGNQRRSAKAINFGLIYGMSAFGLARQLGIERGEAQDYVNLYFSRYPGVRAFMDQTREQARERGFVETVFGRRLYLPEIRSRNVQRRQYAERTAINAPMQGTAADLIKLAMIAVQGWLDKAGLKSKLIMQVHDELVLEVPENELETIRSGLPEKMCGVADLKVPLKAELGVGPNWESAH